MQRTRLQAEDRNFFGALASAVVMNPFSLERARIMRELGAADVANAWSVDPLAYDMARELNRRLDRLDEGGPVRLEHFGGDDRAVMDVIFVYQFYHHLIPALDGFIVEQLGEPHESRSVPFAREALRSLIRRGFDEEDALRYFAFAYQLRRAFYFIVQSLIGVSESIRRLREQLWNCVFTFDLRGYQDSFIGAMGDFSTLLLGETGTGKGQAAAAIGRSGFIPFDPTTGRFVENFSDVFVATNLSRYPESLIESELFGHRKGAFTGALADREGLFERCSDCGSLFLDEIGDVSAQVQVKLLDVLDDRVFHRVGDNTPRRFAGRVIAATHRPLADMRREGDFRDDFYYRLSTNVVQVPSLRERIAEDPRELELLVGSLVARNVSDPKGRFKDLVMSALASRLPPEYAWPGNVRELEQVVRAILLTGEYQGNPLAGGPDSEVALEQRLRAGDLTAEALLAGYCRLLYRRIGTYAGVAQRVGLDRRTVKSYVERDSEESLPPP